MDDPDASPSQKTEGPPKIDEEVVLKYKERGFQKVSFSDYLATQTQQAKRRKFRMPLPFQILGKSLFFIIFCFGIVFIPHTLFIVATNPVKEPPKDKTPEPTAVDAPQSR